MIEIINKYEKKVIDNYLKDIYYKSLYLYANYVKYGLKNKKVLTFKQVLSNKITCILLKYYNTLHVISQNENEIDIKEVYEFFNSYKWNVICGTDKIIKKFYEISDKQEYKMEIGYVRELNLTKIDIDRSNIYVVDPNSKDLEDSVKLICSDKDFATTYNESELKRQMVERINEKYGRSYIIKLDNKIIAHAATAAENQKSAIISFVVVSPEHRRKGYAYKLLKVLCHDIISEGKKCYLMNYSDESSKLYEKIGFEYKCSYGKCFRINS